MSRRKKISLWVMGIIGGLLALLVISLLLLPRLINLEPVKKRVLTTISQRVGGKLEFQRVDLSFFPRPRVVVHEGSLSFPGKAAGTIKSLTLYPRILPLLRGNMEIARLRVEAPDVKMKLPERPEQKEGEPGAFSSAFIEENVAPILGLMASKAPGLILQVEKGRLYLSGEQDTIFWFHDVESRMSLPPDRLEIDISCKSNLWEDLSLKGLLDPRDFKANGRIQLADFQPQALTDFLFPLAPQRLGDSHMDLDVSFNTEGLKALQAEVEGSLPILTLRQEREKVVIRGKSLKGVLHMDEDGIAVSLAQLDLDYPQLSMSGKFRLDQKTPYVSVDLEGKDVDVHSTREAALALAGEEPTVQEIFNYVRGGKVPLITLSAQGSSVADLGELENILIKGNMVEGKIFIPGEDTGLEGLDLDLEDAKGDAVISGGILEGKNLEARWGSEKGRDGTLKLGLEGEDAPFHLEVSIEANLSRVPPLLKTLIEDEAFAEEIARAHGIKGRGVGRLVVGESTKSAQARVDVSKFNLSARYDRLPYPLEIQSGRFSYDVDRVSVKGLSGRLGKSVFSGVAAQVGLKGARSVEVLSGKSTVLLDEIYTWLSTLEGFKGVFKRFKSVQGTIALSTVNLKFPLLKPQEMRFRAKGKMENLTMVSTLFPGPVAVTGGDFEATPERISIRDARVRISDCTLRVGAFLHDPLKGLKKADLMLEGKMGPEGIQRVSDLIDLPPRLRVRSPLSLSGVRLGWERNGEISFSGNLVPKGGPEVSIDMIHDPIELMIRKVSIRDKASQASFGLALKEREFHLNYKGNLEKRTLDRLLVKNQILTGALRGDFNAHILLDNPMRSTAQGRLHGVGLGYPVKLMVPVTIEDVSLEAKKNRLKVQSAMLKWGKNHLNLDGSVDFSEEEFLIDMNLSADGFEWENVKKVLEEEDKKSDLKQREDIRTPPVKGILRVRAQTFAYEKYTWRPFHADITFRHDGLKVAVTEANLCGIATPGTLDVFPEKLQLVFQPISKNQDLDRALACLWNKEGFISGNFNLQGEFNAQGKREDLTQSLGGDLEFLARDGRIFRFKLLSRIIGYVNLTEIFRAKVPDLGKEGLAYDSITIKGDLQGGKFILKEAILDGATVEIVGQGEIDLSLWPP
jgi:hypothetical protein